MKNSAFGFIAGTLFFFAGLFFLGTSINATKDGIKTEGRIVDVVEEWDDGNYLYAPVMEFKTPDGAVHRSTSTIFSSKEISIGRPIRVIYKPEAPEKAVVDGIFELYLFPLIFVIPGAFFMVIFGGGPLLVAWHTRWKQGRS